MIRETRIAVSDGLHLAIRLYGADPGLTTQPPILCLPGLTRNGRDFHQLAERLVRDGGDTISVITVDSRGRGGSDRDPNPERYTLAVEAGDVLAVCAALGIGEADFIGTSRGGLILHLLAVLQPALLRRLVLNDIGPVIETVGLQQIQAYLDPDAPARSRCETIAGLKRVHGPSFPTMQEEDWADMAEALYREENGLLVADYDPAIARITRALDLSQPLPDLWTLFDKLVEKPLLVIRGENSALLSRDTVEDMTRRHPSLRSIEIPGEGHAPLLHKDMPYQAIRDFLGCSA